MLLFYAILAIGAVLPNGNGKVHRGEIRNSKNHRSEYILDGNLYGEHEDKNLYYALCRYRSDYSNLCRVIKKSSLTTDKNALVSSCDGFVINKSSRSNALLPLTPNHVVLVEIDKANNNIYMSIINMNTCSVSEHVHSFNFNTFISNIFLYEYELCRLAYLRSLEFFVKEEMHNVDNETKAKIPIRIDQMFFKPVDHNAWYKGYYGATILRPNNETSQLKVMHIDSLNRNYRYIATETEIGNVTMTAVSNAHNRFAMCWRIAEQPSIRCLQTNTKNVRLNVTIDDMYAEWMTVYNMAQNDSIVLVTGYWKLIGNGLRKLTNVWIRSLQDSRGDGKIFESERLDFICSSRKNDFEVKIFENHGHVCVAFACGHQSINGEMSVKQDKSCVRRELIFS